MAINDNDNYTLTGAQVKDLASQINAKEDSADLATVAETGSYDDLTDKPTIPASFSDLSGTASTSQIADNAVTASKIDFTSFIAGAANFSAVNAGGSRDVTVNIPTQTNTNYLVFLQLAGHTGYWTNLVYRPGTKTTTSFVITAYNSGGGASGTFQIHYLVIPQ